MTSSAPPRVAIVAPRYPSRSETFVYREVEGLRKEGFPVVVASLRRGTDEVPGVEAPDVVLYGSLLGRTLLGALAEALCHPWKAAGTLLRALADAVAPGESAGIGVRLRLPFQSWGALALARALRRRAVAHVHCHFAHAPSTVGMYAARQLGVPFSFTGHANDLFQRRALLRRKLRRAAFVSCISEWHRDYYREAEPSAAPRFRTIRCGVDTSSWTSRPDGTRGRQGNSLLTVARLVEKKGIDTLVRALGRLVREGGASWSLVVVGDGPLRPQLEALAQEEGCGAQVRWLGPQDNERVRELLAEADVFVLPCREDARGDRDGIPVVLMEAMACGVPVVSGDLPAIRELVKDGETGRLVDGARPEQVAEAIRGLSAHPEERERLGSAGRRRVEAEFSLRENVRRLAGAIQEAAS